ncbi:hypothetical protein N7491_005222 [Penicillium cf. griseofulvum]|uniref:DUF3533 domain-containing protein n=1 Tax=Penicillium cf. griseofulvum TaxID=2972120 RepID=A0A9W9J221_9EURO|nr:hypothetical protein N7472_007914 [Penicillium cf. griseofulvum]KAJ5434627.1 hypothetical protein N7491_005222 [Penicillium cf. griseofulvum]KAJ5452455.1 hypothetical protein N7445_000638 [Penicillium cf. griseofulvum]
MTPDDTSPPVAVSFFDQSLKEVRRRVFYQWARTLFILCAFIFGVLSLFWGSQYHTEANYPTLKVWIVDFDGQVEPYHSNNTIVGPVVTEVTNRILQSDSLHLGYTIKSAADFNYDPWAVRQSVYDQHAYAAVITKPNATMLLHDAVSNDNTTYDPTGAIEIVIISARDQATYYSYILPDLAILQQMVREEFGPKWIRSLASSVSNLSSVPPQAINPAIGFTTVDLRPFAPAVAAPAVTIGLIYLIIIAFFNFPFLMPAHVLFLKSDGHPPLKVPHWLIWRVLSSIVAYFFLSLSYSLVSLAFQITFDNGSASEVLSVRNPNAYGRGSFVVFWMLNWVGMAALGFPCENMAMMLGFPWSACFLIFWVITNVATGFYAIDLAPGFYRWGYAWPLHRIVEAMRTILFDTHSRIGLDFAILFIWIAVSLALYPFAAFVMRWKMKRGM